MRSLNDVDWEQVDGPAAVPPPPALRASMDPFFDTRLLSETMATWREHAKFDTLDYVSAHPLDKLGVVVLAPCKIGDEGWTKVRPDGSAAYVNLRCALQTFALPMPKDHNVSFPALVKKTKWGWSLVLDVAGKKYVPVEHREDGKKDKETKP